MKSRFSLRLMSAAIALFGGMSAQSAWSVTATPEAALPGDLSSWTCVGNCGSSAANGDITLAPQFGSAKYGYVSTADSTSLQVSPLNLPANSRGAGTETNGSKMTSSVFSATEGSVLSVAFNYVSTDGKGYDDYAWARILNASNNSLVAWVFAAESTNSGPNNIVPGKILDNSEFDPKASIVDFKNFDYNSKTAANPINWSPLGGSNGACWQDNADGCGFTGWLNSTHTFVAAGNYKVEFGVTNWGDTAYDSGLAFDFRGLTGSPVSAVPEPETYAMLLAGLGIIGLAKRRKEKATAAA